MDDASCALLHTLSQLVARHHSRVREAAREQRVRLVAVLEGGEVEECAVIEVQLDRVGDQAEDGVAAALDRGDALERQLGVGGGA